MFNFFSTGQYKKLERFTKINLLDTLRVTHFIFTISLFLPKLVFASGLETRSSLFYDLSFASILFSSYFVVACLSLIGVIVFYFFRRSGYFLKFFQWSKRIFLFSGIGFILINLVSLLIALPPYGLRFYRRNLFGGYGPFLFFNSIQFFLLTSCLFFLIYPIFFKKKRRDIVRSLLVRVFLLLFLIASIKVIIQYTIIPV